MVLASVAVLAGLFAGWIVLRHYRAKSALAKYEQQLLAKGEKLTFYELFPPLPPGENKAFDLLGTCAILRTGAVLMLNLPPTVTRVAPGKLLVITKEKEWTSNSRRGSFRWEQLGADLKLNGKALDDLRAIVRSPVLRYPLNYRGLSTLLPHLGRVKNAAQHLSMSALYNVHEGRIEKAVDDIEAMVLLSRVSADEPILISQWIRIAIVSMAVQNSWEVLQADGLADDQLARLQKILDIDLTSGMVQAGRGERVMARDAIRMLRSDQLKFGDLVEDIASQEDGGEAAADVEKLPYDDEIRGAIRHTVILPMWRFVWSYEDERHTLEEVDRMLEALEQGRRQQSAAPIKAARDTIQRKNREDGAYKSWSYWATRLFFAAPAQGQMRAFHSQVRLEMARTATALKRYQLRHGKYPAALEELVPELLAKHPVDWMNGQKLRYRVEGDSFVLWSVGENGIDDGGKPSEPDAKGGLEGPDMVWPRAASEAEVEAYKAEMRRRSE
jgi:hypothetical protein